MYYYRLLLQVTGYSLNNLLTIYLEIILGCIVLFFKASSNATLLRGIETIRLFNDFSLQYVIFIFFTVEIAAPINTLIRIIGTD